MIPADGGEARGLTSLQQGVGSGLAWSPDGKFIAFTAGPASEPPDPQKPYRVTRHVYRFDGLGYLDNVVQDIYVIPVEGGEARQLTRDPCMNSAPHWSPDGQALLYTATMIPDSHQCLLPRLRVVNLEGEVREIVGNWGFASSAAWTPDGKRIVFMGAPHGRPIGSKSDLWVIGRQGGEPVCRTAGLKFGVGGFLQPDMPALWENWLAPNHLRPSRQDAYVAGAR